MDKYPIITGQELAKIFESWCGVTPWSKAARDFGALGGKARYWCGMPRCASAIPLTFELFDGNGNQLPCNYRLKDIKQAIVNLGTKPGSIKEEWK